MSARAWVLCGVLLWLGCAKPPEPEGPPPPLTAKQGLSATLPAKPLDVGEDCSAYEGNDACGSKLCLRVKPGLPPTGFCSIRCRPDDVDGCPDGPTRWRCSAVWPGPEGFVCTPEQTWKGARATWKGGPVPVRVAPMALASDVAPDAGRAP